MTTPHEWEDEPEFDLGDMDGWVHAPEESSDASADESPQTAQLPDGSALRLTGPGAGTTVQAAPANDTAAQMTLPTRDEALGARRPLLLVHRAARGSEHLPRLLGSIVAATRGQLSLGTITPLPRGTALSNEQWLTSCAASSVRVADPAGYKLDSAVVPGAAPSPRSLGWWPYLGADPMVPRDVLDAQRQVGANLLLSPGRAVDPADPQNSLDLVFAEADQALAELQVGERLALNLTLPRAWLTRQALRDQLLAQLLDQEQFDVWYVRVQWPSSLRSAEQPVDLALLEGYKRLAQLADDEERTLLLPQTGLTGWLQLAFGAAGFGSGLPGSDQASRSPQAAGAVQPRSSGTLSRRSCTPSNGRLTRRYGRGRATSRAPAHTAPRCTRRWTGATTSRSSTSCTGLAGSPPTQPRQAEVAPPAPSGVQSGPPSSQRPLSPLLGRASRGTSQSGIVSCRRDEHVAEDARQWSGHFAAEVQPDSALDEEFAVGLARPVDGRLHELRELALARQRPEPDAVRREPVRARSRGLAGIGV